jgi:hypothetical protein
LSSEELALLPGMTDNGPITVICSRISDGSLSAALLTPVCVSNSAAATNIAELLRNFVAESSRRRVRL